MTRPLEKERERFFVERTAELLGKAWSLDPGEHPDFIVTEPTQRFGLEVAQIFTGKQSRAGSEMKRGESDAQRAVDALRGDYEAITNIPLSVRLVGDMCSENMATVVPALVAMDLSTRPIGHHEVVEAGKGLRVHVTRAFNADWFSVDHRVGWVDRYAIKHIADRIKEKAEKLPLYIKTAGPDIRLLIVADRIHNSGKLMLGQPAALDMRGFQGMYFLSYPETVTVFDSTGNTA
jgi:hypothetical protein